MKISETMMTGKTNQFRKTSRFGTALKAGAALGLLLTAGGAMADDSYSMAPPVDSTYTQAVDETAGTQASVFNWTEVPENQQVPINRAVFDRGGYQLYDSVGETIVVPFANQNLYVMKFGPSTNGSMYFVNEGGVPVLYVPRDGYLENASASGARWYPFSKEFHPSEPVFLGIAPSWPEFVDMGWYPGMYCYGGYYSHSAFISGGIFLPTIGLSFFIGGHPYYGWGGYHDYYRYHPAPYHVTVVNNNFYRFGDHDNYRGRSFQGTGHAYTANHNYGSTHSYGYGRTFRGAPESSSSHGFGGGSAEHPYYAHRTFSGASGFGGSVNSYHSGASGFGGSAHAYHSEAPNSGFGGGSHTFQGNHSSFGGGSGERSYARVSQPHSSGTHSFSGGNHSDNGGGRSYGGGGGRSDQGGGGGGGRR